MFFFNVIYVLLVSCVQISNLFICYNFFFFFFFFFFMQRFITCRFLDVANTMLEITDFCPKLRFFSILITDFNFQRLAALVMYSFGQLLLKVRFSPLCSCT